MRMDDFTLYVPLRDRLICVDRVAKYYADLPCRKLFVDSTRRGQLTRDSHYESFEYYHVGPILYHQKIYLILTEFIKTPLVLDVCDDDVALKRAIIKCVEWLREHDDYALCDGEYTNLTPSGIIEPRNCSTYYAMTTLEPTSDKPSEQFYNALRYYLARNHAVMRTSVSRLIFKTFVENDGIRPIKFIDRVFTSIAGIMGNFKTLPILYQIKTNRGRISHRPAVARELRFGVRIKNNLDSLRPISDLLTEKEQMDPEEAHIYVKRCMLNCLTPRIRSRRNQEFVAKYKPSYGGRRCYRQIKEVLDAVKHDKDTEPPGIRIATAGKST